jgi:hypothetical protein
MKRKTQSSAISCASSRQTGWGSTSSQASAASNRCAFDRIGRPVQRAEHGFVNQFACACIVVRQFLCRHHAFDDLVRRHRSRCIPQDVMDAPTTVAWTKPVVAPARWCRLECFGLDVWIKQPHGRFEMRQIGAMLIHLRLKTFDRVRDFQSLIS